MKLPVRTLSVIAVFAVVAGLFAAPAQAAQANTAATVRRWASLNPHVAAGDASLVIAMSNTILGSLTVAPQYLWTGGVPLDDSAPVSTASHLHIESPPSSSALTFQLDLVAAQGETLHVGDYTHLASSGDGTAPLLTGATSGNPLTITNGEVNVLDLATDSSGQVIRYDIVYLFSANFWAGSTYGEVRMGEPEAADHLVAEHSMAWPLTPTGVSPQPATEWIYNTSSKPLTVGTPSFTGANAGDFSLLDSECSMTLAVGELCSFRVGYAPLSGGPRSAVLNVPVNGRVDQVNLSSASPTGLTDMVISGDNFVTQGQSYDVRDGRDNLGVQSISGPSYFNFVASGLTPYDQEWDAVLDVPPGEKLAAGTFTTPVSGEPNSLNFSLGGLHRGCDDYAGTVTIRQLESAADGTISRLDLTFVGTCDGGPMKTDLRYRSTVTFPETVRPGPARVAVGAVVPITGTTTPGAQVSVLFRGRGASAFVARRTLTADASGQFATAYTAMDDCSYYVNMGGFVPVVSQTQIQPTMTGTRSGHVVTLTGMAIPSTTVQLSFQAPGRPTVVRNVAVDAHGRWVRPYTASAQYLIGIRGLANGINGPSRLVKAS